MTPLQILVQHPSFPIFCLTCCVFSLCALPLFLLYRKSLRIKLLLSIAMVLAIAGGLFLEMQYSLDRPVPLSGTALVPASATYIGTDNQGRLESHSLRDWSVLWRQQVAAGCPWRYQSANTVYCFAKSSEKNSVGILSALRSSNGALLWQRQLRLRDSEQLPTDTYAYDIQPTFSDNLLLLTPAYHTPRGEYHEITVWRLSDGTLLWKRILDQPFFQEKEQDSSLRSIVNHVEHSGERVLVTTSTGHLAAFQAQTGVPLWQIAPWKASVSSFKLQMLKDKYIFMLAQGESIMFSARDGKVLWRKKSANYIIIELVRVGGDATHIYLWQRISYSQSIFFAIDPATGYVTWSWNVSQEQNSYSLLTGWALEKAGALYIITGPTLSALTSQGGRHLWQYDLWQAYPTSSHTDLDLSASLLDGGLDLLIIFAIPRFNCCCFLFNCPRLPKESIQGISVTSRQIYWRQYKG